IRRDLRRSRWRSAKLLGLPRNNPFMALHHSDGPSMGEPTLKEKAWEPSFEESILASWKAEPNLYAFAPARRQPVYVIDTPPPYPSGSWHIGAVMAYSMIDMIARAHRMLGRAVLFPFGLDRNGINIERTVEKKTGKPLHRWDREAFIAECRKEIEAIGNGVLELAIRVGMSADFARTYYTDSDEYRAFSQAIFLELRRTGLVYRGERLTCGCPEFGSGAAMVCSYGDMVDLAMFRELRLEPLKAIDETGRMTEAAGFLKGLKVDAAREKAIDELRVRGALDKVEPIQHQTPICSRSLNPIEFISSDAWYLKQLEFREDLKRLAHEMEFRPLRHRQLLLDWTESLTIDWAISRRRL